MRKLGEQWVEELDGKKHMLKAAEAINKGHVCNGCAFNNGTCDYKGDECPVPKGCYIKDLGILNEDGLLPCPFCGEYPEKLVGNDTWCWYACNCRCELGVSATRKEAIDTWNRRA